MGRGARSQLGSVTEGLLCASRGAGSGRVNAACRRRTLWRPRVGFHKEAQNRTDRRHPTHELGWGGWGVSPKCSAAHGNAPLAPPAPSWRWPEQPPALDKVIGLWIRFLLPRVQPEPAIDTARPRRTPRNPPGGPTLGLLWVHPPPRSPQPFSRYDKNMATREKSLKSPVPKVISQHPPLATPRELRRSPSPKPAGSTATNPHPRAETPVAIGRDSPAPRQRGRDGERLRTRTSKTRARLEARFSRTKWPHQVARRSRTPNPSAGGSEDAN